MAPLTWREVSAPNFSSVNQAQALVGDSISQASKILQSSIAAYGDQKTRENSANFMGQVLNGTPLDQIQGVDPSYLDPEAFNFALNVQKQNEANALGYAKLAQLGKGKGGKGSSGSQGGDVIPVAPGTSDGNFLTSENQIIPGVVTNAGTNPANTKGKKQLIPTAPTVSAPTVVAPQEQAPAPIENFAPMPAGGPLRGDQTSQVSPEQSPATQIFADTVSSFGAPLASDGLNLSPTPGALRGAPVKGNDGAAQIFFEQTRDLGNARNVAIAGFPDQANAALTENKRIGNNLTGTNLLTTIDNNLNAAITGQKFREGERTEQEEVRKLNQNTDARIGVTDIIANSLDRASAMSQIPTDLNPEEFAAWKSQIDLADKNGQWNLGDPNRPNVVNGVVVPPGNNPVVQRENIIASMVATPEGAKKVAEETSTPEGAAKFQAAIDKALQANTAAGIGMEDVEAQHKEDIRLYNRDRGANPDISALSDLAKGLEGTNSSIEAATKIKKSPGFETSGVSINDLAAVIERTRADAKVSPDVAAAMVLNSLRGAQFGDGLLGLVYNQAELSYDADKLEYYKSLARDPISGKPRDQFIHDITNLEKSDKQRDNLDASYQAMVKATNQYNSDVAQSALGGGKAQNLVKLSKAAMDAATKQYYDTRSKFVTPGGVTRQNSGEPAPPPLAKPPLAPYQGPRQGTVNQSNADELLRNAINAELSIPALENTKRLGVR
ncbi:hypothetical protein EVC27_070 [Rhizobium phage RHph_I1_6]|uniref:Uncharacterized protein n=1 Tax=Rhizobium phage RHph_I1_6 TaxID=2509728 RepID=A0A7S5RFK9_9CAUD|nr:virion structural protein [Rhizobium phage RHph_I1_6]QIG76595.1 hypothetical protein EVC27_070 [Rhizobium phage RHph_I1_6]